MKGFFNKLLRIDLDQEKFIYEDIEDKILEKTLGGKGLASYILKEENPKGVDSLSPDNVFIIAVGPITGTKMWSHSRAAVYSKSPQTNGYGESYCGGTIAPKIKGCGVDAIIIKGKCKTLKFLTVDENKVEFKEAKEIKLAKTQKAEKYILENSPEGSKAMVIGPAGENLVKIACIKSDIWRSFGRGGMGAVLGAKNIKGISFNGNKKCEIADEPLLTDLIKKIAKIGKDSPITNVYKNFGTPIQVKVTNSMNCFPTKYWSSGHFEGWENISADYMQENFDVKSVACPNCFLKCQKHSIIKKGRHKGVELEGPEYETIYAIGGLNEIDSLEEIAWLNVVCDELGIDTMSAGNLSAFAVEAYKAGKIDFEINYNEPKKVEEFFNMIAYRKGIGNIFANGILPTSVYIDMEDRAVHVKGLEPAGFDPRVLKGMGLSYATASRGACHLRGTFYKAELSGEIDKDQIKDKAKLLVDYENRAAIFDSLILCRFFRDFILWEELMQLVEAVTGLKLSKEELSEIANNTTNYTREYNVQEGLKDYLPQYFLNNETKEGAYIKEEDLNYMIKEYNNLRER